GPESTRHIGRVIEWNLACFALIATRLSIEPRLPGTASGLLWNALSSAGGNNNAQGAQTPGRIVGAAFRNPRCGRGRCAALPRHRRSHVAAAFFAGRGTYLARRPADGARAYIGDGRAAPGIDREPRHRP